MDRIRQQLSAGERGDQEALARLRCVKPNTVCDWKAALQVVDVLKQSADIRTFETFQPSHAEAIARDFRKRYGKNWPDEAKEEIVALVDLCESKRLTVKQLQEVLRDGNKPAMQEPGCTVDDLHSLIEAGRQFGCIYADPPWRYANQATRASTDKHYSTLTVEEIAALPVAQLAAPKSHLWLWTTNGFLFECPKLFDAWGFTFRSSYVWVKPQIGIGNYLRNAHELLLLAVRGGLVGRARDVRSWGEFDRGEHSAKPEKVRSEVVERVSPGPYLELFGRRAVPDHPDCPPWTVWGNEVARDLFTRQGA
jgi:N6-adenosine-specific RNA methylase IME4